METAAVMPSAKTKITNPFPGLRPFSPEENSIFFGRDGLNDALMDKLQDTRFVAVVGTSGSGKSSLVRAGLLPTLRCGFSEAGSSWHVAMFRPINNPIRYLATALAQCGLFAGDSGMSVENIEEHLRRSSFGLLELVRAARLSKYENLLIVADQFEELYRFEPSEEVENPKEEASAFVRLLLEATSQKDLPIHVILTMRSDYLGDSAQFWGLPEAINRGQFLIPRMDDDEKREAIEGPVRVFDAKISPSLVNRLLNDVGDDPRQLPILQHALMRTWDYWKVNRRDSEPIGIEHYDNPKVGGMKKALSIHANEAYNQLDSEQQQLAQRIFKRLTEKGVGKREGRLPATVGELTEISQADEADVITVINAFRQEGRSFLMPPPAKPSVEATEPVDPKPLASNTLIDISHESLISGWSRLSGWVEEEAESAKTYGDLVYDALRYPKGKGLLINPELDTILKWQSLHNPNEAWARRYRSEWGKALEANPKLPRPEWAQPKDSEYAIATTYLDLSKKEHDRLETSKARKRWGAFITVSAIAILFFAFSVMASILARRADADRRKANEAESEAVRARVAAVDAQRQEIRYKEDAYRLKIQADLALVEAEKAKLTAQAAATEANRQKSLAVASEKKVQELAKLGEGYELAMASFSGDTETAIEGLKQVRSVYEGQGGGQSKLAATDILIGNLILGSLDIASEKALPHFNNALTISRKGRAKLDSATFMSIGDKICESYLENREAIPFYERAIELADSSGNFVGKGDAFKRLGDAYFSQDLLEKALGSYNSARAAYAVATIKSPTFEALKGDARTLTALGRVSEDQDDNDLAISRYRLAQERYQSALDRSQRNSDRLEIRKEIETLTDRIRGLTSIIDVLDKALKEEGIDSAVKLYRELKATQGKHPDFREPSLNSFGYVLLRQNKVKEAIEIFKLNIEAYPKSSNTYDSLGDAYRQDGNKELAIKYYEEAIRRGHVTSQRKIQELKDKP